MGMDDSQYLGPFLRCETKSVFRSESILSCPNAKCVNHKSPLSRDKFCAKCGTLIASVSIKKRAENVDTYEVSSKFKERLTVANIHSMKGKTHFWIANAYPGESRGSVIHERTDEGSEESYPLTSADIQADIAWFEHEFAKEIKAIEEAYGAENVKVQWGLLHWYS